MNKLLPLVISLFFLDACVLQAPCPKISVEIPDSWRISVDESSSYANFGWWEQLDDLQLNCLIKEALDENKDLKVTIARVDEFIGRVKIAQSGLFPQLSGNFTASRQGLPVAIPSIPSGVVRTFNLYTCLLNASYDLDLWGRIRSESDAAIANLFAQVEARRTVVLNLVAAVASAYIQLKQFDMQLQISRQTYQSRKEAFRLATLRFLGGLTSELEAKQSEADMETAAAQVIQFELAVAQQENLLSVLIGHPPQSIPSGIPLDQLRLPPRVPAGLPSEILQQRPDIIEAEQRLVAANANIGAAKAQFFPDISLTGIYGNESTALSKLFTGPALTWLYGISLLQPILTGGLLTGQLEAARAQKWEAYYHYQQTVLTAFQEVDDALISHQKSKERLSVEKNRVAALKDALHLATLQYNNGQVDYLNVLDAERHLFEAQLDEAQSQSDTFLSFINIYKALGGGWVIEADNQAAKIF